VVQEGERAVNKLFMIGVERKGCFEIKVNKVEFFYKFVIESTEYLSHMRMRDLLLGCQSCWLVMVSNRVPIFAHIRYS